VKLGGGVPTISFRDLAIQRRENDLVGASFGRGFYVLDDYSALREASEEALSREAALFPVRKAWWYVERDTLGWTGRAFQGSAYFMAENPPFGAVFTYHLAEEIRGRVKERQEREKPLVEAGKDTPWPGWTEVEAERREAKPAVVLVVKDACGRRGAPRPGEDGEGLPPRGVGPAAAPAAGGRLAVRVGRGRGGRPARRPRRPRRLHRVARRSRWTARRPSSPGRWASTSSACARARCPGPTPRRRPRSSPASPT
jgi:hypothetical protein